MASNETFETRFGRFGNADGLIQANAAYNPVNPLITKAGNTAFIVTVENANASVITTLNTVNNQSATRKMISFVLPENVNPDCIERRIEGVVKYMKAELGEKNSQASTAKAILKKMRPHYKGATKSQTFNIIAGGSIIINNVVSGELGFNTGTTNLDWSEPGGPNPPETVNAGEETTILAPSGTILVKNDSKLKAGKIKVTVKSDKTISVSQSEKTFAGLEKHLTGILTCIAGIGGGFVFAPVDPLLHVGELTAVRDQLRALNISIQAAELEYGTANRNRKELYDNKQTGMNKRIELIKDYLITYPGRKKNTLYIEFVQAIKGT